MVVGNENANLDITPNNANGTFATSTSSEIASFNVTTNNYTGYILSISASDDDGELIDNNTLNTLNSITSITDADTFANDTTSTYKNKWGIKPSKYVESGVVIDNTISNNYLPAPTTTPTILDETNTANTTANNYTIALGAKIDYTKPSGTYTNTYTLTAVVNYVAYAIEYIDSTDTASGIPGAQSGTTGVTNIALSDATPTRTYYTFGGWCIQEDPDVIPVNTTGTFKAITCNTTKYNAGANLPLDETTANIVKLYAVWNPPTTFANAYAAAGRTQTSGYYSMQDINNDICSVVANYQTTTLRDGRDGNTYTVAKINGNCWMTQNLRFSGTSINPSNTNINTTKNISWGDLTSGDSYDVARYHNSGNTTNGYWYNYAGASAMTITSSNNSTETQYSICPANWRIPKFSETSGITISYKNIFKPVTSGIYKSGSVESATSYGCWWSSTANNGTTRLCLYYNGSNTLSTDSILRTRGLSLRCLAQ